MGNPLYGDDGFGSCLAQFLLPFNDFVQDGNAHGIAGIGSLLGHRVLVFVDVDYGLPPGAVALARIEGSLTLGQTRLLDSHRATPSVLVGYLRAMGREVEAWLVAVGPRSLDPLSPPSPEVLTAAPKALELLSEVVSRYGYRLKWEGDPRAAVEECYRRVLG